MRNRSSRELLGALARRDFSLPSSSHRGRIFRLELCRRGGRVSRQVPPPLEPRPLQTTVERLVANIWQSRRRKSLTGPRTRCCRSTADLWRLLCLLISAASRRLIAWRGRLIVPAVRHESLELPVLSRWHSCLSIYQAHSLLR